MVFIAHPLHIPQTTPFTSYPPSSVSFVFCFYTAVKLNTVFLVDDDDDDDEFHTKTRLRKERERKQKKTKHVFGAKYLHLTSCSCRLFFLHLTCNSIVAIEPSVIRILQIEFPERYARASGSLASGRKKGLRG